jgi:hypothetical protein
MLPIVSDRTQAGGSDKGVARNVVHFELAGVDVAQYEIRCARSGWSFGHVNPNDDQSAPRTDQARLTCRF